MIEVSNKKKSYKKIILLILLLLFFLYVIFIFVLGFIKSGNSFLVFAKDLYTTLEEDNISEGVVDKSLLNEEFSCDDALYYGSSIEFYGCIVEDDVKSEYCLFDGNEVFCGPFDYTPNIKFTDASSGFSNIDLDVELFYDISLYKEVLYCTTTDNKCVPNIKHERNIITLEEESISNKVCVQSIDLDNKMSEILCSDNYKIDKTKPIIKDPIIHGTFGNNGWYTSDVSIELVEAVDELSSISSTVVDKTSISGNTIGEKFSITAVDNAGNVSVKDYLIKIDKTNPTGGSIIINGELGDNGWYISPVIFEKIDGGDRESGYDRGILSHNSYASNTDNMLIELITMDKAGNTTRVSRNIKMDVLLPVIDGADDLVLRLGDTVDLFEGITATDEISGLASDIYIKENNINYNVSGSYQVIYGVMDNAGNEGIAIRNVSILDVDIFYDVEFIKLSEPNDNGWYKEDFYIKANVDKEPFDKVKYCYTTESICSPNINYNNENILINKESATNKVCVQVEQPNTLKSDIVCSEDYKLDKSDPVIENIGDLKININSLVYPLGDFARAADNLSGIDNVLFSGDLIDDGGIFKVDTSVAGSKVINYELIDVAGNTSVDSRVVTVLADNPTISFSDNGVYNNLGWSNSDILVNISAVDYSNTGLGDILYCVTSSNNCIPNEVGNSLTISNNHSNNRVCASVLDNIGNSSGVVCSDNYKLDKVVPVIESLEEIKFKINTNVNLSNKLKVLFGPSNGSVNCNIKDTSILAAGLYNLECSATSNSSLSSSINTTIEIYSDVPTINFVSNTYINDKGWANADIDLYIDAIDYSDSGIKEVSYCVTDASSCEPNILGNSLTLNVTGKTVCAKAIDNALQESEVYCSDEYKIDKMVPILSQIEEINMTVTNSINIEEYFTVGFGISAKDTFRCSISDTTDLSVGVHPLTCTAISNSGTSRKVDTVVNVYATPYIELEYLESTGDQYIYTDLMNSGNYIFESEFMVTNISKNTGSWLLSGRSNFNYTLGIHFNNQGVYNAYGTSTSYYQPKIIENTWYSMYFSINTLIIGDNSYPVRGQTLIPESFRSEMIIGGNNLAYDNTTIDKRNLVGKIKYFKISDADSGVLIRDYIPVEIIESGELGYWDLVNSQFYSNDGAGEFIAP